MSNGRTIWWAKDCTWHEREANVILGEEFGAEGPHLMDVMCCQAKLENHGGRIKTGYTSLARRAFISNGHRVREIIRRAVEIGALDDFEESERTFSARISGWDADQELASSRERQRRYRERLKAEGVATGATGPIRQRVMKRDGHACLACGSTDNLVVDHVVPKSKGGSSDEANLQTLCVQCNCDKGTRSTDHRPSAVTPVTSPASPAPNVTNTGQDRTEQDREKDQSDWDETKTIADLFDHWRVRCRHADAKLTADRRTKIRARLRDGYTPHQIRRGIDGAATAPYVNENGKRFDDLELICRSGSKLEDFISRADTTRRAPTKSNASSMLRNLDRLDDDTVDGEVVIDITEAA